RASARQREVALRLAIGASRGGIIRQFLIESTLLAAMGAACGIGLAWTASRAMLNLISTGPIRVVFDLTPTWHVLGFTSAIALATVVLFGVVPAFQATSVGPSLALKEAAKIGSSRS